MNRVEIALLGPLRVCRRDDVAAGAPLRFRAESACALLAYLARHPNAPCRRETIAGLLWPEVPDPRAFHNLRLALHLLRRALAGPDGTADMLRATRRTVMLALGEDCWVDVAAFEASLDRGLAEADGGPGASLRLQYLREAAGLYGGDLAEGFSFPSAPYEAWLVDERERLRLRALQALGGLAACHERRDEWDEAAACARRQIALEPCDEGAHRTLLRCLALAGHRGAALAHFAACCRTLAEDLGVEPEPATLALYQAICEGSLQPPKAIAAGGRRG